MKNPEKISNEEHIAFLLCWLSSFVLCSLHLKSLIDYCLRPKCSMKGSNLTYISCCWVILTKKKSYCWVICILLLMIAINNSKSSVLSISWGHLGFWIFGSRPFFEVFVRMLCILVYCPCWLQTSEPLLCDQRSSFWQLGSLRVLVLEVPFFYWIYPNLAPFYNQDQGPSLARANLDAITYGKGQCQLDEAWSNILWNQIIFSSYDQIIFSQTHFCSEHMWGSVLV